METFKEGDRVIFTESTYGEPEPGVVTEVIPPDEDYPNGGIYIVRTDAPGPCGYMVEAWVDELTPEPNGQVRP